MTGLAIVQLLGCAALVGCEMARSPAAARVTSISKATPTSPAKAEASGGPAAFASVGVFTLDCEGARREIQAELVAAGGCQVDEDCTYIGAVCPFGCRRYVNRYAELDSLRAAIAGYKRECNACRLWCQRQRGTPVCCAGRCQLGDGELGLYDPEECKDQSFHPDFEQRRGRWFTIEESANPYFD